MQTCCSYGGLLIISVSMACVQSYTLVTKCNLIQYDINVTEAVCVCNVNRAGDSMVAYKPLSL